jgi:hypothetical protein
MNARDALHPPEVIQGRQTGWMTKFGCTVCSGVVIALAILIASPVLHSANKLNEQINVLSQLVANMTAAAVNGTATQAETGL